MKTTPDHASRKLALTTQTLVRLTPQHLDSVMGGLSNIDIKVRSCLFTSCRTLG